MHARTHARTAGIGIGPVVAAAGTSLKLMSENEIVTAACSDASILQPTLLRIGVRRQPAHVREAARLRARAGAAGAASVQITQAPSNRSLFAYSPLQSLIS